MPRAIHAIRSLLLYWTVCHTFSVVYAKQMDDDDCLVRCNKLEKKPVCASDGKSYPSKCEVRRQRICYGPHDLDWVHEGECSSEKDEEKMFGSLYGYEIYGSKHKERHSNRNCTVQRTTAELQSQDIAKKLPGDITNVTTIMIPKCKPDGTWEEVQCHPATNYCWCVTVNDGRPVPKTSVQNSLPNCRMHEIDGDDEEEYDPSECSDNDRTLLTADLLSTFAAELSKLTAKEKINTAAARDTTTEDSVRLVVWKFNSLDGNRDEILTRKELRGFKYSIKHNNKPKGCSKHFLTYCDKDKDTFITLQEWKRCLGGNSHFLSLSAHVPQEQGKDWNGDLLPLLDQSQTADPKEDRRTPELMNQQKRLLDMLNTTAESSGRHRTDLYNMADDRIDRVPLYDQSDLNKDLVSLSRKTCMDERKSGLLKAKESSHVFIPKCQQDGRYEQMQCHQSSGYCWCVNADTGVPIPGTSRLKENPDCDRQVKNFPVSSEELGKKPSKKNRKKPRVIPGCQPPHHESFLTQLTDVLTKEMASSGAQLPAELANNPNMSLEEKALRWKFLQSDKDKDQKLNKTEMKFIRNMMKKQVMTEEPRCGRKFITFCDRNKDKHITMEELLICTDIRKKARRKQRKKNSNGQESIENYFKQSIKNPFTELLMPSAS